MRSGLKLLFFIILFAQTTQAQVILMIDDETKSGFKLVMNGFLQNETALPKLNLQKFPADQNQLTILLNNGLSLKHTLPRLEDGIHQYVIYKDYKGKIRFRYRGVHNTLSQSAIMIDYHDDLPYPIQTVIAQVDTTTNYPEWKEKQKEEASLVVVDSNPKEISGADLREQIETGHPITGGPLEIQKKGKEEASDKPKESLVTDDATSIAEEPTTSEAPKEAKPINLYQDFIAAFKLSEFEFDKLKLAKEFIASEKIDEKQAVEILKGLKYDQSRLDFLQFLISKQAHLKNSQEALIACFDYDLTKNQAKKLFAP